MITDDELLTRIIKMNDLAAKGLLFSLLKLMPEDKRFEVIKSYDKTLTPEVIVILKNLTAAEEFLKRGRHD